VQVATGLLLKHGRAETVHVFVTPAPTDARSPVEAFIGGSVDGLNNHKDADKDDLTKDKEEDETAVQSSLESGMDAYDLALADIEIDI
jgi:hypothetical protein